LAIRGGFVFILTPERTAAPMLRYAGAHHVQFNVDQTSLQARIGLNGGDSDA
jgi:hypothetical protein